MGANEANPIGQSILRKEDVRFLTGAGQFTDDVNAQNATHAYFLRSPHAHARIRGLDTSRAKAAPGVVAIFTGDDLTGVNGLPCGWLITGTDGKPMNEPPHPVLAKGKVRHVGDPVALVIAESRNQAKDAAELIDVDYEVLPAVVNCVDAQKSRGTAGPRRGAGQPLLRRGRSATRRRSTPHSPRPRTSRSSTWSTTGWWRMRSSRALRSRRTTGPMTRTRSMSRARTRMSSAC